jgi:chemotaxis signal transduction protein
LLPVVRIDRLFGLPAADPELHTPLVVLRAGWILLASRATQVAEIGANDLRPVAENHCFNDCAVAQLTLAGEVTHLLDPERLLVAAERQRLAELQAAAERRREQWEPWPAF